MRPQGKTKPWEKIWLALASPAPAAWQASNLEKISATNLKSQKKKLASPKPKQKIVDGKP